MRLGGSRLAALSFPLFAVSLISFRAGAETPSSAGLGATASHRPRRVLGSGGVPDPQPTAEGEPTGDLVAAIIGPEGGVLASTDGACMVTVPPGALPAPTELTLQPTTNVAWGAAGPACRLGPPGTTLGLPVTVTFHVDGESAPASLEVLGIAEQDADSYWHWIRDVVRIDDGGSATGAAEARLEGVSERLRGGGQQLSGESGTTGGKALVTRFDLAPGFAVIKRGAKRTLMVCAYYGPETAAEKDFGYPCYWITHVATSKWAVNGKVGGDSVFGTISGNGGRGVYRAPSDRPEPEVVHVSVHVSALENVFEVDLRSRLSIYPPNLSGWLKMTAVAWPGTPQQVSLYYYGDLSLRFATEYTWEDEKNLQYKMDGFLTALTTTFNLGNYICTLDSAAQQNFPVSAENPVYFHIDIPEPSDANVHFVLDPLHWDYRCSPGGLPWPFVLSFGLLSGTEGCATREWVPVRSQDYPSGKFKETCNLGIHYDADWQLWADGSEEWNRF